VASGLIRAIGQAFERGPKTPSLRIQTPSPVTPTPFWSNRSCSGVKTPPFFVIPLPFFEGDPWKGSPFENGKKTPKNPKKWQKMAKNGKKWQKMAKNGPFWPGEIHGTAPGAWILPFSSQKRPIHSGKKTYQTKKGGGGGRSKCIFWPFLGSKKKPLIGYERTDNFYLVFLN